MIVYFATSIYFYIFSQLASSAIVSQSSSNLGVVDKYCTNSAEWIGTDARSIDCIGAVQSLYAVEVQEYNKNDFEFLSQNAKARLKNSMRTPRKYALGETPL